MTRTQSESLQCICGSISFCQKFVYDQAPKGETKFAFSSEEKYQREILQCKFCNHFLSIHDMATKHLYSGEYVDFTYGEKGLKESFDRINALPPEKSDNVGRAHRINEFSKKYFTNWGPENHSVLDIGSGICVFLDRMKQSGWDCTALDPDERAIRHAREVVKVKFIQGDFMKVSPEIKFNVVTFNKVLEHVSDPISMLKRSKQFLKQDGFVYVEVPDGETAALDDEGFNREEFFIEHEHIFSYASLVKLAKHSGFLVKEMERLQEPSSKYTVRAFLAPQ